MRSRERKLTPCPLHASIGNWYGDVPEGLKYTEEHEWVRLEGDEVV